MKRIVTVISLSAVFGAASISALHAGGPPDGGYQPQAQSTSPSYMPSRADRDSAAMQSDGARTNTSRDRMADRIDAVDAKAGDAKTGTFYGLPAVYTYPVADGSAVRPGHIGGVETGDVGTPVSEITGQSTSVAALALEQAEDTRE